MNHSPSLVWFRLDLRLADNPALQAAVKRGGPIIPFFIYAPDEEAPWEPGAASRWWLHQSLAALDDSLRKLNSKLIICHGPTLKTLRSLAEETDANAIFWNRRYEPAMIQRDEKIRHALRADGLQVESFNAALLHEPWTIRNKSNKPFQVFTPFLRCCLKKLPSPAPLLKPRSLPSPNEWPRSLSLKALELEPKINWVKEIKAAWVPGEAGAHAQLKRFLNQSLKNYSNVRNLPGSRGTSRLSAHLHFGEISPRQIWHAISRKAEIKKIPPRKWQSSQFITELGWREFSHHLLFHFPQTPEEPLRPEFKCFPWRKNPSFFKPWQKGLTGYPIVDAGMRELWATGWMHNRVRMIVGSFLVKDLLISWQEGARWFWDTLVDADLAQNTLGWQWTAGCGADAAPYFRVFNPIMQGEKFDPDGVYVRKWCPELAKLPNKWIHRPWEAPGEVLASAGITMGQTYPEPIVPHSIAREIALEAFAKMKSV